MPENKTDEQRLKGLAFFFYDRFYNLLKEREIDRDEVINQAYIAYHQVGKHVPYVYRRLLNWLQRMNSYSRWYNKSYQDQMKSLQTIMEKNQSYTKYPELLVGSEDETIDQLDKERIMEKFIIFLQASSYTSQQQHIIMCWLEGESQDTIAKDKGVSPSYVSRTKERAMKEFKQYLKEGNYGESF